MKNIKQLEIKKIIPGLALAFALTAFGQNVSAATLSLSPTSTSTTVGQIFDVAIILNTQNTAVFGADVFYLNFNPNLIEVVDQDSSFSGVQLKSGTLLTNTVLNEVDNQAGRISFSQVSLYPNTYNGSGTLATLKLKMKSAGTSNLSFNFVQGSTTDSNVATENGDVLSLVSGATYTATIAETGSQTSTTTSSSSSSGGSSSSGSSSSSSTSGSSSGGSSSTASGSGSTGSNSSSGGGSSSGSSSSGGSSSGGSSGGGSSSSGSGSSSGSSSGMTNTQSYQANTAHYANITTNLYKGVKSDSVLILQKVLTAQGLLSADNQTGFFGPITEKAVQEFQKKYAIVSTGNAATTGFGVAGPKTLAVINSILTSTPIGTLTGTANTTVQNTSTQNTATQTQTTNSASTKKITTRLELKSKGDQVLWLQQVLIAQGLLSADSATGYFGPLTEAAVKKFQKTYNIVSSGTPVSTGYGAVGPTTRNLVNSLIK